jgi:hypothetical protein
MTYATEPANVTAYLQQLRAELADLAPDERDDLLAEVEASLLESAGDEPLDAQFGPPAAFAADLRASAGLPPAPAVKRRRTLDWRPALDRAKTLAPIWWALRGYVAVAAFALAGHQGWFPSQTAVPRLGGSPAFSAAVIGAAVLVSIAIGLLARVPRSLALAGNAVLLAALIPVAVHLAQRGEATTRYVYAQAVAAPTEGLAYYGNPVTNIYPYDRTGRLLHDVRLYGADGHPLNIGKPGADPTRRSVETSSGPALNAFPIRYFDPGTGKVTRPDAGPHVLAPPITTAPLSAAGDAPRRPARHAAPHR